MEVIVITSYGSPGVLQIQEREKPRPAADEVLIKVKAAGVNRPDVIQRKGNYAPPPGAPQDIPGLEVAGMVEETGSNVINLKNGDHICALIAGGGYAQYTIANALHCLPVPTNLNFTEAASLPETVLTVWHNVFQRGQLKAGEKFLVHGGSSGIGITAIQLAKAFDATVFTTAGSKEKCDACIELGASKCINYKEEDFETVLKDEKIDVILDMIGGDYIERNIRLLNIDGRLVFINAMKGGKSNFDAIDIMRRRLTITGSTLRNRDITFKAALTAEVHKHVWPIIQNGKFKPVIYKTFPLPYAAKAHELMESSEHIGKIVLLNED
jgi:NADPH2:quinone reductase